MNQRGKMNFRYPKVRRDDSIVDNYHGLKVRITYSWK